MLQNSLVQGKRQVAVELCHLEGSQCMEENRKHSLYLPALLSTCSFLL